MRQTSFPYQYPFLLYHRLPSDPICFDKDFFPIGCHLHRTLAVRTKNTCTAQSQIPQRCSMGMPESIALSAGNDRIPRMNGAEKRKTGGSAGTMMSAFENICPQTDSLPKQRKLLSPFGIAGQKHCNFPVGYPKNHRTIIRFSKELPRGPRTWMFALPRERHSPARIFLLCSPAASFHARSAAGSSKALSGTGA